MPRFWRPRFVALLAPALAGSLLLAALIMHFARDAHSSQAYPAVSGGQGISWLALMAWPTPMPPTPTPTATLPATPTPERHTSPEPPAVVAPPAAPPPSLPRQWLDGTYGAQVLAAVNAQRSGAGLLPLSANTGLTGGAQSYAHILLDFGRLSHSADGLDTWSRAAAAGYSGVGPVGETLWSGVGPLGPDRVLADWIGSAGHRDVLFNPGYTQGGIGCYFQEGGPKAVCVLILGG